MGSQEQIDNANLLLTQHRLKLEWNQMVWSLNNLRCGIAATNTRIAPALANRAPNPGVDRSRLEAGPVQADSAT